MRLRDEEPRLVRGENTATVASFGVYEPSPPARRGAEAIRFLSGGHHVPVAVDTRLPAQEGRALYVGGHVCEVRFAS